MLFRSAGVAAGIKASGRPGFLQVVPLTFAPLDARLIDRALLTDEEYKFVQAFQGRFGREGA